MKKQPLLDLNKIGLSRWQNRAAIWIGIGINPASITLGGGLASTVPLSALVWLIPLGCLILTSITVAASLIGRRTRQPLAKWSASVFGVGLGAILLNLMMALGMTGWHGFQLGLSGSSLSALIGLPDWIGIVAMAGLVVVFANMELNRWSGLAWVTTLSSIALVCVAIIVASGGSADFTETAPFTIPTAFWVVGSIISYAGLFAMRSPDIVWDLESDRDVYISGALYFCVLLFSISVGVYLYRATGDWNLPEIFAKTSLAPLGLLFVTLSLVSPALSSVLSGGLAYGAVFNIEKRSGITILVAIALTLGVTRFDRQLLPFLDWIGTVMPPALVVMLLYYYLRRPIPQQLAIIAWIVAGLVAIGVKLAGLQVHLYAGTITSIVIVLIGMQFMSTSDNTEIST